MNLYGFIGNFPISAVDPYGLKIVVRGWDKEQIKVLNSDDPEEQAWFVRMFNRKFHSLIASALNDLCCLVSVNDDGTAVYDKKGEVAETEKFACCCLEELIDSERVHTIAPYHLGEIRGGYGYKPEPVPATVPDDPDAGEWEEEPGWGPFAPYEPGTPGKGSGTTIYVNPYARSYERTKEEDPWPEDTSDSSWALTAREIPMWVNLGHELCGHALLLNRGESAKRDRATGAVGDEAERQAIRIENALRREKGYQERHPYQVGPKYRRHTIDLKKKI